MCYSHYYKRKGLQLQLKQLSSSCIILLCISRHISQCGMLYAFYITACLYGAVPDRYGNPPLSSLSIVTLQLKKGKDLDSSTQNAKTSPSLFRPLCAVVYDAINHPRSLRANANIPCPIFLYISLHTPLLVLTTTTS